MADVLKLVPKLARSAEDLRKTADDLREVADQIERGEVVDHCMIAVRSDGHWDMLWWCSLFDGIGLSAMLHDQALRRMRG